MAAFPFPDFTRDYEFVALRHPNEYPFNEGRLVSNKGLDIAVTAYDDHFVEEHVPYSNALPSVLKERGAYFASPLARYNLNFDQLSPLAQEAARAAGLGPVCHNPFHSIVVRSVEILYACDEALRLIDAYEMPERPAVDVQPRAATGYACTEAPRGILYHRYRIDEQGIILDAKIVPPTSQNQKTIENDLYAFIPHHLDLPKHELTKPWGNLSSACGTKWRCYAPSKENDVHERSLIADLMRKIAAIAREESARKVISVKVQLGALCHLSAPHLREHFAQAAGGTVAEGARLDIEVLTSLHSSANRCNEANLGNTSVSPQGLHPGRAQHRHCTQVDEAQQHHQVSSHHDVAIALQTPGRQK